MKNLSQKNVLILGLGSSGLALARWCIRCGASVTVADTRPVPPELASLQAMSAPAVFVHAEMNDALLDISDFDMVL